MSKATIQLPPKLVDVFQGEARYRGSYGGRGSGKTRTFALMTAVRAYMWAMEGRSGQILCGREFQNSLEDSSFVEVKAAIESVDWLKDFFDIGRNYIRTRCGKISYTFQGLRHNIDSVKSKGKILLTWVDEAENVSEVAWTKLIPTVREDGSEIWVTWNPESDESATHMRFRDDPPSRSKIVELNYTDNPWFPDVLEQERLDDKRKRPETYKWIWEGDFNKNQSGKIYAKLIIEAKEQGRITKVPYYDGVPVFTVWDLGHSDATAIWFCQVVGFQLRVIDYYENNNEGLAHYAQLIRSKQYEYSKHYLPHDGKHERLGMEGSIQAQLKEMGLNCAVLGVESIEAGIEAARTVLKSCYIDDGCGGIKSLKAYGYKYDENRKTFSKTPVHDWSSHAADAFRGISYAMKRESEELNPQKTQIDVSALFGGGSSGSWMG